MSAAHVAPPVDAAAEALGPERAARLATATFRLRPDGLSGHLVLRTLDDPTGAAPPPLVAWFADVRASFRSLSLLALELTFAREGGLGGRSPADLAPPAEALESAVLGAAARRAGTREPETLAQVLATVRIGKAPGVETYLERGRGEPGPAFEGLEPDGFGADAATAFADALAAWLDGVSAVEMLLRPSAGSAVARLGLARRLPAPDGSPAVGEAAGRGRGAA